MTTIELKTAIRRAVDNVPENVLSEIFDYINSKQPQTPNREQLYAFIDKVFKEDDEVLKRLAQ